MDEIKLDQPRCPYCHEDIAPASAQRACNHCRAWHHQDCLEEAGLRCCACSKTIDQTAEDAASRAALARLYVILSYSVFFVALLASFGGAFWGLDIGLLLSALLALTTASVAGLGATWAQRSIAGVDLDEHLNEEIQAFVGDDEGPLNVHAAFQDMAKGLLGTMISISSGAAFGIGARFLAGSFGLAGWALWIPTTVGAVIGFMISSALIEHWSASPESEAEDSPEQSAELVAWLEAPEAPVEGEKKQEPGSKIKG